MDEPVTERLKRLREAAQPKLTVRAMAEALGLPLSTYAAYETSKKYKKPILPLDFTKQIASILEPRGVDRAEILRLAGVTGELSVPAPAPPETSEWVEVSGSVAAGVWKAESDWPLAERYEVRFGPPPYPGAKRFAVRMDGLSMNRTIPDGADLECLWVKFSNVQPKPGDLVIAERTRHDLCELTCKRLGQIGDEQVLLCESTEPEFQYVIHVGSPSRDSVSDDVVQIVGIVLSAKIDLAPRGLSERRYRVR